MQKRGSMSRWSAYMGRILGGSGVPTLEQIGAETKQMDEPERWSKRVKEPDGDYELDLVETFFTSLDLN